MEMSMDYGRLLALLEADSEAMKAAILRGLEAAYPATKWHTWEYNMSSEYSGHVEEVITGIRAAVKPLLEG
jgi:hypothetical protein